MHRDLIDELKGCWEVPPEEQAARDFTEACRRVDSDPRERQRILDIADLINADDIIHEQAVTAIDRGDLATAVPLLRRCAAAGIGESAWLLAVALEELGSADEATDWYARAAADGDERARARLSGLIRAQSWQKPDDAGWVPDSCIVHVNATGSRHSGKSLPDPRLADSELFVVADANGIPRSAGVDWWVIRLLPRAAKLRHWGIISASADRCIDVMWHDREGLAWMAEVKHNARARVPRRSMAVPAWSVAHPDLAFVTWLAACAATHHPAALGTRSDCLDRDPVPLLRAGGGWVPRAVEGGQTARDVMLPLSAVPALAPDTTVYEALEQVLGSASRALPVRDGPGVAGVAGVVTLADLAQRMYQAHGAPSIQRVGTLMQPPSTVPSDMAVTAVMAIAAEDQAGLLIVTGADGTAVGYLTPEALLARTPGTGAAGESQPDSRPFLVVPGQNGLLQATVR